MKREIRTASAMTIPPSRLAGSQMISVLLLVEAVPETGEITIQKYIPKQYKRHKDSFGGNMWLGTAL